MILYTNNDNKHVYLTESQFEKMSLLNETSFYRRKKTRIKI